MRKILPDEVYTKGPNHVIQGTAFEVMGLSCVTIRKNLKGLDAIMSCIVHDEAIVECSNSIKETVATIVESGMIQAMLELFPESSTEGLADAHWGSTWKEAKQ